MTPYKRQVVSYRLKPDGPNEGCRDDFIAEVGISPDGNRIPGDRTRSKLLNSNLNARIYSHSINSHYPSEYIYSVCIF